MIATIVVVCIVAVAAALAGALIALRVERGTVKSIQAEHEAWVQAQENYRHAWERKQAKRFAEAEAKFTALTREIRADWETWTKKDAERIAALAQQYDTLEKRSQLEQELARLPHVEEMPLGEEQSALSTQAHTQWHPAMLRGVDLSGRDLSHRYLRSADLREARLVNANLFMADLSGALLTGANLRGADLSGANLSGADLRDAILADTNVQVADLHNALLVGANLIGARHLNKQQLADARYDDATRLDDDTDLTEPQLPIVRITAHLSVTDQAHDATDVPPSENHETDDTNAPIQQQPVAEAERGTAPIIPEQTDASPVEVEAILEMPISATSTDEPPFDAQTDAPPVEVEAILEMPLPSVSTDEPEAAFDEQLDPALIDAGAIPETPLPLAQDDESPMDDQEDSIYEQSDATPAVDPALAEAPEADFSTLLPDLESLLESSADSQFFSPLAPNDSLLDLHVTDRLVEQQEEAHTVETDVVAHRPKHSKGRRARARNH